MIPISLPVDLAVCAPKGLSVPLERSQAEDLTRVLKAIADPTRLQLLSLINSEPESKACVCDMAEAVELSQPTISHHLKVLTDAGLLERDRQGTWVWYSLNVDQWSRLQKVLG
ncbi:metalloregulator ArsR/SmtB family transcription factor [Pontimonas sp.]|uniref:ArsR/SmtB family transcription factor n=1 Tax=Pontimonas sp. TaxID=2304492 RepID=UPI00286FD689|nr:metalloregulator ArsR/SmtB family transcription factor [Pontimonas sp.]MDR9396929.1 metalloregulator ArsR/SmtB family transcription factor [Pontimonas sp.]MDR9434335.1 metalloregulator ArsR/SmtB family transcription factor [Pontimonas sp.]